MQARLRGGVHLHETKPRLGGLLVVFGIGLALLAAWAATALVRALAPRRLKLPVRRPAYRSRLQVRLCCINLTGRAS